MRITITVEDDIHPATAALYACYSIRHWSGQTEEGKRWSPGAIIAFDIGLDTSTRQTSAGWTVKVVKAKQDEN